MWGNRAWHISMPDAALEPDARSCEFAVAACNLDTIRRSGCRRARGGCASGGFRGAEFCRRQSFNVSLERSPDDERSTPAFASLDVSCAEPTVDFRTRQAAQADSVGDRDRQLLSAAVHIAVVVRVHLGVPRRCKGTSHLASNGAFSDELIYRAFLYARQKLGWFLSIAQDDSRLRDRRAGTLRPDTRWRELIGIKLSGNSWLAWLPPTLGPPQTA